MTFWTFLRLPSLVTVSLNAIIPYCVCLDIHVLVCTDIHVFNGHKLASLCDLSANFENVRETESKSNSPPRPPGDPLEFAVEACGGLRGGRVGKLSLLRRERDALNAPARAPSQTESAQTNTTTLRDCCAQETETV